MKRSFTVIFAYSLILLLGCTGNIVQKPLTIPYSRGTDTVGVSNPNKAINSFVIKAADNPGLLTADVSGNITFDSVKLIFEPGTNLSNLIPTITITGKSISPASGVPENFDSTVIYTVTATDGSQFTWQVVSSYK